MAQIKAKQIVFNQTQMVVTDEKGRAWHRDHTKMDFGQWDRVQLPEEPDPEPVTTHTRGTTRRRRDSKPGGRKA